VDPLDESGFDESFEVDLTADLAGSLDERRSVTPEEETAFALAVIEFASRYDEPGFRVTVAGIPVMNYELATDMGSDMQKQLLLASGIISLLLLLLFRRISGLLLPLITVLLSLTTSMALFPIFGWPITGNTQVMPAFLMAVGVADAVHILAIFYARYESTGQQHEAITYAMKHTGFAIVLTSITTAAGLISFASADLMPVRGLGIFGAIGVMLALIYTVALVPALLAIFPIRRHPLSSNIGGGESRLLGWLDARIAALGHYSTTRPRVVVGVAILLTAFSIAGIAQTSLSHDPLRWYPEQHPVRYAAELYDRVMSGTQTLEIVFDSGEENGLYEPRYMKALEEMEDRALSHRHGDVVPKKFNSILTVIKQTHRALHEGREEFYAVPDERDVIAQELFLFENGGSDDLEDLSDSQLRRTRSTLALAWSNVIYYDGFMRTLLDEFNAIAARHGYPEGSVQFTGVMAIFSRTLHAILTTMIKSYVLACAMVFLLMAFMMGGFRGGVLASIPNLLPILFTLGLMGWLGIPLNMLTTLIGCIIIGIAVDDTIHFMHHFRKYSIETHDSVEATRLTLHHVGRALVFTSVALLGGFLVFLTATFSAQRAFGILLGFSIVTALIANLMLAPALMTLFWKPPTAPSSQDR
jgi:predicted RND superfamily exporter protein